MSPLEDAVLLANVRDAASRAQHEQLVVHQHTNSFSFQDETLLSVPVRLHLQDWLLRHTKRTIELEPLLGAHWKTDDDNTNISWTFYPDGRITFQSWVLCVCVPTDFVP